MQAVIWMGRRMKETHHHTRNACAQHEAAHAATPKAPHLHLVIQGEGCVLRNGSVLCERCSAKMSVSSSTHAL
jgi:hypothetical protein